MSIKEVHCPHDKLFKNVMSDIRTAEAFFRNYLPASIIPLVDFKHLTLCPNTFIDKELSLHASDVLYRTKINGQMAYLYLLCEHQSSIDVLMAFRLWNYIFKIWNMHINQLRGEGVVLKKLPLIIPMVFYHGNKPWNESRELKDIIEGPSDIIESILFKPFHLIDANTFSDEELGQQERAGLLTFIMKSVMLRETMKNQEILYSMLRTIIEAEGLEASELITTLLNYLVQFVSTSNDKEFFTEIKEVLTTTSSRSEYMGSLAEYLKEEGRQQGELIMLQNLLKLKFGNIPNLYQGMIEKADSDTLLMWGAKILRADTLDEIFEESALA
jgi:recombination-promoting nuclease RpnB